MKSVMVMSFVAALSAVASLLAPPAQAMMQPGNYDVLTNRYTQASWAWFVSPCQPYAPDCLDISAIPRLKFYAYYDGDAHLVDGRYTLTVDVNDGLRCLPGYSMPTRDRPRERDKANTLIVDHAAQVLVRGVQVLEHARRKVRSSECIG